MSFEDIMTIILEQALERFSDCIPSNLNDGGLYCMRNG